MLHKKISPSWVSYLICAIIGTAVMCGFWYLTGKVAPLASAKNNSAKTKVRESHFWIPQVYSSSSPFRETYINVFSKSPSLIHASFDIITSDGSTISFKQPVSAGTHTLITGSQLMAAIATQGKTVANRFGVTITVDASKEDVHVEANLIDTLGSKNLTVKTLD
jgi:hypothetical protein